MADSLQEQVAEAMRAMLEARGLAANLLAAADVADGSTGGE